MKNPALALAVLVVAGAALAVSAPASAASYVWTFSDPGDGVAANGTFLTSGSDVVSGGGQVNGDVLTLIPYSGVTPDGLWIVDSKIPLDIDGLLFDGASGIEYNLWSDASPATDGVLPGTLGASYAGSYIYNGSNGYNGVLTVSSIPEPAAWAMMIAGFGGVGAMMRIARRRAMIVA